MLLLVLKSSACLAVFMVFYKLFLEKESIHQFKRFYLLGALLVSLGIPFITFTQYIEINPIQNGVSFQSLEFSNTETFTPEVITTTWQDYIPNVLWSIYFLGVALFSFRFILNLKAIFHRIKTNPKHQYHEFTNVLIQDLIHPHTFFKYIFLNKTKYEHNLIPNEVMLHEQTHAKQKHALDILCIEVLQIIFWFNPLLYFIKKDIKLNHEFLADQAVLQNGFDATQYKQTLLAFSSDANELTLSNAINYSLIKKRFTVMKTQTSKQAFWVRSLVLLPILAILIYSFSEKEIVEKEVAVVEFETQQQNRNLTIKTNQGATEAMMKEYKEFINNTEKHNIVVYPKLQRAISIYDMMTETQRTTVKKYPKTPLVNLSTVKPKTPTTIQFNSWKNKEQFAIWIDGKNVPNKTLNNYNPSDIKYFTVSKVYNNARTEKHPQPFQNNLYTKKGFEESYLKSNVKKYNTLKNNYLRTQKTLKQDNSELLILKAQLDRAYNILTKEDIEKYDVKQLTSNLSNDINIKKESKGKGSQVDDEITTNTNQQNTKGKIQILINNKGQLLVNNNVCKIENLKNHLGKLRIVQNKITVIEIRPEADTPKEIITKIKTILKELDISKENLVIIEVVNPNSRTPIRSKVIETPLQQKATPEEIEEYNAISKRYNSKPVEKRIYKLKDIKRLKFLYNLMGDQQKKNVEPFPKIAPPPPPKMDTISTYNSLAKRTKFIPSNRKNNIQHLKVLFDKMSSSQKEKVESPNSVSKYIAQLDHLSAKQIKKVNEIYNKIKTRAQSKGRKFYSAAEYKELEKLYSSMLRNIKEAQ